MTILPHHSRLTGQQLDWSIWRRCPLVGKVRLDTPEHAERRIQTYKKRYGWKMRAYRCLRRWSYHLARIKEKKQKA